MDYILDMGLGDLPGIIRQSIFLEIRQLNLAIHLTSPIDLLVNLLNSCSIDISLPSLHIRARGCPLTFEVFKELLNADGFVLNVCHID
jgi:hypothetical protein